MFKSGDKINGRINIGIHQQQNNQRTRGKQEFLKLLPFCMIETDLF